MGMKTDLKILIVFSIISISLMISNEFIEFISNIYYTSLSLIVISFFYQNKHNILNGTTPPSSPSTSPINNSPSNSSVSLTNNNNNNNNNNNSNKQDEIIKQLNEQIQKQKHDINIYYEKNKEDVLKTFNEKNVLTVENKELREKLKSTEESQQKHLDQSNSLNLKLIQVTKERDQIYSSEQKLLSKIIDLEKKEKSYQETEKQQKSIINELKDTNKTLKKENEECKKKLQKYESKLLKLQNNNNTTSGLISKSPPSSATSTPSSSTFQSPPISIPKSISSENILTMSSDDDSSHGSPSSSFSTTSTTTSDTPKQIKSLLKNFKNDIFSKAQKSINKRLGPDFFTPTTLVQAQPSTSPSQIQQPAITITTPTTSTANQIISPKLKFEKLIVDEDDTLSVNGANQLIKTEKSPRSITLTSEDSLGDLVQNIDFSKLSSFKDDEITSTTTPIKPCIISFAIKESENKVGLRKAKKKPLQGQTDMMEDVSFAKSPFNDSKDIGLFGVFDGHAGKGAALSASTLFPIEFQDYLNASKLSLSSVDQSSIFTETFNNVDTKMKSHEYEGCTATVCFIWRLPNNTDKYLQVANLGDSSAFLFRGGKALELTFDHKANAPSERQRLIDAGIQVTDNQTRINGIAVSRSLGNHFVKEQNIGMIAIPHISSPYKIQDDDQFIIIASDGLWDTISGQLACESALEKYSEGSSDMASLLLSNCINSPLCKDNVTVLVIKLN